MWFIYIIKSSVCNDVYIGSTKRDIRSRFNEHLYQFRIKKGNCSVNRIIEKGIEYLSQELLEEVNTDNRYELLKRERWWIQETPNVVNHVIPLRNREEASIVYNERNKERRRAITQPTKCECGFTYYYGRKENHEQTKRHKAYISKLSLTLT